MRYRTLVMTWGLCVLLLGQAVAWGAEEAEKMLPATPAAVMIGSTAMVPLQAMAELMGGTITVRLTSAANLLDGTTAVPGKSVEFTLDDYHLVFTVGSTEATVQGETFPLPMPPFERAGVVYVPLRVLVLGTGGMLSVDKQPHRTLAQVRTRAGWMNLHLQETKPFPTTEAYHEYDTELYVCNPDGSELQRLTYNTQDNALAGVSPDGRSLAYAYDNQLCLRAFDDPVERVVAPWDLGDLAQAPEFSPDGATILFIRHFPHPTDRGEDMWICTVKADGTGCRQWYKGEYARYAPDGECVAMLHTDPVGGTKIYRMDADGSHWGSYNKAWTMAFSGDGRYLQYTMPVADGKYVRRVIALHAHGEYIPDSPPFSDAVVSVDEATTPDLSAVVFSGCVGTEDGIHLTDANRTHVTRLTTGPLDHAPSFTADLSHILFLCDHELYSVDRDGSHQRPLVRGLRIDSYTLTPDGAHIIFSAAPENPPITY